MCQLVCGGTHLGAFNPRWARIRVEIDRHPGVDTHPASIDVPHVCRQCEPAPCAEACPAGAFERGGDGGVWAIDKGRCTGCGVCKDACPFGMIVFHDGVALKCDLCDETPMCVRFCPTSALSLVREGAPCSTAGTPADSSAST